ncbi:MAG: HepT-like ribonuclease domain-containing protein [Thermoanaerobaculia bacterium]
MRPDSPKYLEDIRDAAAFVLEATRDSDLARYLENRLLRQAVERNFEIIGEALNRLRRADPETADRIGETPRIVALRNILAHGSTRSTTRSFGTSYDRTCRAFC